MQCLNKSFLVEQNEKQWVSCSADDRIHTVGARHAADAARRGRSWQ
jgi:hypothetical protein